MVVLNGMSRYDLAIEAIKRVDRVHAEAPAAIAELHSLTALAVQYSREHLEDEPEIRDWVWHG